MNKKTGYSDVVETAREYYNSDDAENFYSIIWGGEDIHIGIYKGDNEPIFDASRRTVEKIASTIENLGSDTRILDIGSGYGGAARHLAGRFGSSVVCLNLSEVQNDRNRTLNREQGLADKIKVIDGSFEDIPLEDNSFDVIWSQDAILHSGNREKVLHEADRVLRDKGQVLFTDIMQADECPEGVLDPILARIHLDSLGSPSFYRKVMKDLGFTENGFKDLSVQLPVHYRRVYEEISNRYDEIKSACTEAYLNNMLKGLEHWVDGGKKGYLVWGIFHFVK